MCDRDDKGGRNDESRVQTGSTITPTKQEAEALRQTRDTPDNPNTFNIFPLNIQLLHFCVFHFSGC